MRLTLGVTFGCGYVFIITCLAGALLPYRAKQVYDASPGAKYQVSGLVGLLFTLLGVAGFVWISWVLAPQAFASYAVLDWLVRIGSIVAVLAFLYPMRKQLMEWLNGKPMPWLSALGMLGGGLGHGHGGHLPALARTGRAGLSGTSPTSRATCGRRSSPSR